MNVRFENLAGLHWLWLVAAVAAAAAFALALRRRRMRAIADTSLLVRLAPAATSVRPWWRRGLVVAAMITLVAALIDPRWGLRYEQVQQRGIDVFIVLDVSRSMLAEDVRPNRLDRAKQHARDVVEAMRGDRVGLITFAGSSTLHCPLTSDYGALRLALIDVTAESAPRGGTRLGDALRLAGASFTDDVPDHKVVFIISDGEDHGSAPVEEARKLGDERGVRVYAIGLGDETEGARVPVTVEGTQTYLTYEGQQVWSKMDARALRDIALAGDGAFIAAGTRQLDAGAFYREKIEPVAAREIDAARLERYTVQYQWFAGLALVLLTIESCLSIGRPSRTAAGRGSARTARRAALSGAGQVAAIVTVLLLLDARAHGQDIDRAPAERAANGAEAPGGTGTQEVRSLAQQAREALDAGRYDDAAASYEQLHTALPRSPEVLYNLALALHGRGDYDAAAERFLEAMGIAGEAPLASDAAHNLIGTTWAQTEPLLDAQGAAGAPPVDPAAAQSLFEKAPERLERAIDHYRRRLAANPEDAISRRDAEVAHRLIKNLEALAEQMEQQQGGQEKEDEKDKDKEKEKQEQEQQQKQGQQQEQQEQQQQQGQQQEQPQEQGAQQQSAAEQEQENQQQQGETQEEPQQGEEQQEQQSSEKAGDEKRESTAGEEQRDSRMTREEAERLLQQVRDKERQRREMLARQAKQSQAPVDKDW